VCENGLSIYIVKKRKPILLTAFSFQSREKNSFEHHWIVYASNHNNTHVYKEREKKRLDTTANIVSSSRDTMQRRVGRSTWHISYHAIILNDADKIDYWNRWVEMTRCYITLSLIDYNFQLYFLHELIFPPFFLFVWMISNHIYR